MDDDDHVKAESTSVVRSDPEIPRGIPVFDGTSVPVHSLFDYLEGGERLDEFLNQFPLVSKRQALAALNLARDSLLALCVPLDEKMPLSLAIELTGHRVRTMQAEGWSATKNGELVRLAHERFRAQLTMNRGLQKQ